LFFPFSKDRIKSKHSFAFRAYFGRNPFRAQRFSRIHSNWVKVRAQSIRDRDFFNGTRLIRPKRKEYMDGQDKQDEYPADLRNQPPTGKYPDGTALAAPARISPNSSRKTPIPFKSVAVRP
jgi:hypothetical protein